MIAYRMNSVAPNPTVQRDSFPALILNCSTVRTIVSNVECEQRGSRITPSHAGSTRRLAPSWRAVAVRGILNIQKTEPRRCELTL